MTLYSFRIYEGETLLRDFVPCFNDALGAGLYEVQTGEFHANAGTGEFTCSPDPWAVVRVPAHVEDAWTSGDGAVTNVIEGGSFRVLKGTENVKVIITPDPEYVDENGELRTNDTFAVVTAATARRAARRT